MRTLTASSVFMLLLSAMVSLPHLAFSQNNQHIIIQRNQQQPGNKSSKEKLARAYYQSREYQKAAELYEQLYAERPAQHYYTYLFNCLLVLKEYKRAEKLSKKQIKTAPKSARYIVDHAYVLKLLGNEKKADKIISGLIDDLPNNRSMAIQLSHALQSKGFNEQALASLQKAKEMPGNEYSYGLEMANIYQSGGEYGKMFDAYLDYLEQNPQELQRIRNRLQSYLRHDVDNNMASLLKKKLFERAQENPDNLTYTEMLLWYSLQTKNFRMAFRQARAIDKRFGDHSEDMLEVADISMANREFEVAADAYQYVKDKKENTPFYHESYSGYFTALVKAAEENAETNRETYRELDKIGRGALDEIGLNRRSVEIARSLAHIAAFKLDNYSEAVVLLEKSLSINQLLPKEKAGLKIELADILLFEGEVWNASLYYSQIENDLKNEPIGHEAKFRNAKLFYFMGEYQWAQAKLDVLRSATSKLIANDAMELSIFISDILEEDTLGLSLRNFGKADLMIYQQHYDSAFLILNSFEPQNLGPNATLYLLYKKANLFLETQQFQQADSLYQQLASSFPESIKADNAIYREAEIQRLYLDDDLKAMDLYMKLMRDYPESIYAGQARIKYRKLRGEED